MYGTVHLPWLGPVNFRDQPCANKVNPLSRHIYVLKKACFSIILRSFQFPSVFGQAAIILVRSFWAIILFFSFFFRNWKARSLREALITSGRNIFGTGPSEKINLCVRRFCDFTEGDMGFGQGPI